MADVVENYVFAIGHQKKKREISGVENQLPLIAWLNFKAGKASRIAFLFVGGRIIGVKIIMVNQGRR